MYKKKEKTWKDICTTKQSRYTVKNCSCRYNCIYSWEECLGVYSDGLSWVVLLPLKDSASTILMSKSSFHVRHLVHLVRYLCAHRTRTTCSAYNTPKKKKMFLPLVLSRSRLWCSKRILERHKLLAVSVRILITILSKVRRHVFSPSWSVIGKTSLQTKASINLVTRINPSITDKFQTE